MVNYDDIRVGDIIVVDTKNHRHLIFIVYEVFESVCYLRGYFKENGQEDTTHTFTLESNRNHTKIHCLYKADLTDLLLRKYDVSQKGEIKWQEVQR